MKWVGRGGIVAAVFVLSAACGQNVTNTTGTPSPVPSPSPSPQPTPDVGNGQDGPLDTSQLDQIINVCRAITVATNSTIDVASSGGLTVGRRVLLVQVQDDFSTSGLTTPMTTSGNAGAFEVIRIDTINANTLTSEEPLKFSYTSGGTQRAQACPMPEYTTVTINVNTSLAAQPWDGSVGGVVAFYANDTVTMSGFVDVTGDGFRGGALTGSDDCNNETNFDTETIGSGARGGGKGEGMDGRAVLRAGRGAMANAAGGGNCHNAGGGGGGNGGAGGLGGWQNPGNGNNPATAGQGGGGFAIPMVDRLSFGGGGGAAHHNDAQTGTPGVAGGGLVMMVVDDITGSGSITSSGSSAQPSGGDGAGGGGAGGTIWLQAVTSNYTGTITATGGDGGDVNDNNIHGPGGGGGGGRIGTAGVPGAIVNATGGANGLNQNGDPHDSTPGIAGTPEALPDL